MQENGNTSPHPNNKKQTPVPMDRKTAFSFFYTKKKTNWTEDMKLVAISLLKSVKKRNIGIFFKFNY